MRSQEGKDVLINDCAADPIYPSPSSKRELVSFSSRRFTPATRATNVSILFFPCLAINASERFNQDSDYTKA